MYKHNAYYQKTFRGMANTLRMRTAMSPKQWQPWKAVSALKKNCSLINKKIKFRNLQKFAVLMPVSMFIFNIGCRTTSPPPLHTPTSHAYTPPGNNLWAFTCVVRPGSGIRNYWPGHSTAS